MFYLLLFQLDVSNSYIKKRLFLTKHPLYKIYPIESMYGIFITYIYHISPLKTTKCR